MKKILLSLIFTFLTTYSLADTGKFNASGAGSWAMNIMNAGNGNMSITYDGNAGLSDKEGSIFDKSTMHCIGGLTLVAGKFDDEGVLTGLVKEPLFELKWAEYLGRRFRIPL